MLNWLVNDFLLVKVNWLAEEVFSGYPSRILHRYLDEYLSDDLRRSGVEHSRKLKIKYSRFNNEVQHFWKA